MNWKPIVVFVLGCVLGFLLMGNGPLGNLLWPPADHPAEPEGAVLAALMAVGFIEVLAFGVGVTFLAFGRRHVQALTRTRGAYATAVWLAIAWTLVNWVPHTALHMSVGNLLAPGDYAGLAGIEYGFHLTLVAAGALLVHACYRSTRAESPTATATPAARAATAAGRGR